MKTTFRIADKRFSDYLKITAGNKTEYFNKEITLENDFCKTLEFEVERIDKYEFYARKIKNPFLKFILFIPAVIVSFLLSALIFFIDGDSSFGIKPHAIFSNFSPFTVRKTFTVENPDNKIIDIKIIRPEFIKNESRYSLPDIVAEEELTKCTNSHITYSEKILKRQWAFYTVPAFCILWIATILLNIISAVIFCKVIREIPLNETAFNVAGIIGMIFCSAVVLALFVAVTVLFVRLYKICKKVSEKQRDAYTEQ